MISPTDSPVPVDTSSFQPTEFNSSNKKEKAASTPLAKKIIEVATFALYYFGTLGGSLIGLGALPYALVHSSPKAFLISGAGFATAAISFAIALGLGLKLNPPAFRC